jgi:hypothetical protein
MSNRGQQVVGELRRRITGLARGRVPLSGWH